MVKQDVGEFMDIAIAFHAMGLLFRMYREMDMLVVETCSSLA